MRANGTQTVDVGFWPAGYRAISTSSTVDANDVVIAVDTGGGVISVTLPSASAGRAFLVQKTTTDANKITLVRAGSESIMGTAANYDLPGSTFANRLAWYVWCDGTNWWVA